LYFHFLTQRETLKKLRRKKRKLLERKRKSLKLQRYLKSKIKNANPRSLGALRQARRREGPAAGWMALAGWQLKLVKEEEMRQSDTLEEELVGWFRMGFESTEKGTWLGVEARVLMWERLRVAAVADLGYQSLVESLPDEPGLWPKELSRMA
jgi:hypothetical protein